MGTNRHNSILMSLLLLVAETINELIKNFVSSGFSSISFKGEIKPYKIRLFYRNKTSCKEALKLKTLNNRKATVVVMLIVMKKWKELSRKT